MAPLEKILDFDRLLQWRADVRTRGLDLVMTNGCFDLVHRGHAQYLYEARQLGCVLLVAINSDASVAAVKGPLRPVIPESDRAYMLASLEAVDAVYVFPTNDITGLLRDVSPDVYVKGGDYTIDTIVQAERRVLDDMGTRIEFLSLVPGISTTEIIRRLNG